ncbi:MAG: hypothetical protein ACFFCT_10810 [Candidatus Odinarchaeota archaeon]
MSADKWLLLEGKMYKLVDIVENKQEAENLALALQENCDVAISEMEDGKLGVYWKPRRGIICPLGVV